MNRMQYIKLIHVAKRELGYTRDVYEQVLFEATGTTSCGAMTDEQLKAALNAFKSRGFEVKANNANRKKYSPTSRYKLPEQKSIIDKIRATWIDMHKSGFINDGSEDALNSWAARMTKSDTYPEGIKRLEWLSDHLAIRVLESLKKYRDRKEATL